MGCLNETRENGFRQYFLLDCLTHPGDAAYDDGHEFAGSIVTTDEVLSEYLTFLSSAPRYVRQKGVIAVNAILKNPAVNVIPQSRSSFLSGLELYRARPDKG